jgi:hypothetical protein
MNSKFGFLSKLYFLQNIVSFFISKLNPAIIHNIEKYVALKKAHYLSIIEDIDGDYLEFGVFNGSSFSHSIRCNKSLNYLNPSKKVNFYGFDSFEGFGELDENDKHSFYTDHNFEVEYNSVLKRVKKAAGDINFKLIKGYFSESLSKSADFYGIEKARIIFLDSDTYSSSKEALDFCKDIVQEGTILILDDYHSYLGSEEKGVKKAFNEFKISCNLTTRKILDYGMGGVVLIISKIK